MLRQTVGFFTNDFAGRIASKIIQTGPALRESVVQVCDALWFVTIYSISSLVLFGQIDLWLTVPLAIWIVGFVFVLYYFVPRIRQRSVIVSEARSMLTGRIVDSYTNIQTVKLFAHTSREDDYALDAVNDHQKKFQRSTRMITGMSSTVGHHERPAHRRHHRARRRAVGAERAVAGRAHHRRRPRFPHRHHVRVDHVDLDRHLRQRRRRAGRHGGPSPSRSSSSTGPMPAS
ncbi:MAG: ABC transporter transmembrane domain-containing protein [Bauldia sp.]